MHVVLGSIVVSISACHAEDPGSIPGRGVQFFFFFPFRHLCNYDCVLFFSLLQESQYAGKTGVVRAILNRMASIYLYDDGREIDVPCRYVEPVIPNKFDKVRVCHNIILM